MLYLVMYLPGHGAKHALAVSVSLPTQSFPPFIGGGRLHSRVLLKTSPPDIPHVLEQRVQGVQDPHSPSRGPAKWQNNVELESWTSQVKHTPVP